jgi:hypothetical protein
MGSGYFFKSKAMEAKYILLGLIAVIAAVIWHDRNSSKVCSNCNQASQPAAATETAAQSYSNQKLAAL